MKIFRFDRETAHHVLHFDSDFHHQFLAILRDGEVRVSVMHFTAGEHVGRHKAQIEQLFAVVQGEGWVEAGSDHVLLGEGRAAFWVAGESHAAGTDHGMTVVVIEGADLHPEQVMREADAAER